MVGYALKFISGKYQGAEFPINENTEILIGRSPDLDLVLAEDKVSRKHAKIGYDGYDLQIIDLGSTNGTYLNRQKVSSATNLRAGDHVQIGSTVFEVTP